MKNRSLKRPFAVAHLALILPLFAGCSSPPELAQVTCCTQRPVNSPEWVERKTLEHEEKLRIRKEARLKLIQEANTPTNEAQLSQELDAVEEYVQKKPLVDMQEGPIVQEPASEVPPQKKTILSNKQPDEPKEAKD